MKQTLVADKAKTVGSWKSGGDALTIHKHGKGGVFAIGGAPGMSFMKSCTQPIPWGRGGHGMLYSPTETKGEEILFVLTNKMYPYVRDPQPKDAFELTGGRWAVETIIRDHADGVLVTLVNWNDKPLQEESFEVTIPFAPKEIRSVGNQKAIPFQYKNGKAIFKLDLTDADFIVIKK